MAAQAERARAELALAQATYLKGPLVAQAGWPAADTAPGLPESSAELRPDVRAAVQRAEAAQAALEGAQALRKNDLTLGTSLDHLPGTSTRLLELRLQMPLAGVLVTAVHLEGKMTGTDLPLMEDVAEASQWPVFASGGVTSLDDMRALEHRGLSGAVLGMALYTGALDARRLAEEFGA